jgi:hypothetical protein
MKSFKEYLTEGSSVGVAKDLVDFQYKTGFGFHCANRGLTSLKGAPNTVDGYFNCDGNLLTSLEHAPTFVDNYFTCDGNKLTSLEHAPKNVGADFWCKDNKLTSLHNIHKQIESIGGDLRMFGNPLKECILGLLKIKKLRSVFLTDDYLANIINKYLPEGDIVECQGELIEEGYEEFAKL